jgi:hypothetical protein
MRQEAEFYRNVVSQFRIGKIQRLSGRILRDSAAFWTGGRHQTYAKVEVIFELRFVAHQAISASSPK